MSGISKKDRKIIYLRRLVDLIRKSSRTPEESHEISRLREKLALLDVTANSRYQKKET